MIYPPDPGTPTDVHSQLIDAVHGAMAHPHFDAEHKADLSKVLGILAGRQAKMHAQQRLQAGPGGPVTEPATGNNPGQDEYAASQIMQALFPPAPPHVPWQGLSQGLGQSFSRSPILSSLQGFGGPVVG